MNPSEDLNKAHRWFAVECNNLSWELFEKASRTPDEEAQMLHAAHASCFHWMQVGNSLNEQRAMCLLTFVHSLLGHAKQAHAYATRCLELNELANSEATPFDRAAAYAAVARSYACGGNSHKAEEFMALAQKAAQRILDEPERKHFTEYLL